MKKHFKYLLLFSMLMFGYNFQIDQANAAFSCSPSISQCSDAKLTYGGSKTVFSSSVYFSKGENIFYSWQNDSPGIFHVAFYVVKGNEKVSDTLYANSSPSSYDYGYFPAPESGFYTLYALCKGGEDNRCQGGGTINRF